MDNVKISDLPITTNVKDGNCFVLVQNGVTKKIAWSSLRPAFYDATPVGTYISGAWETAPAGYIMCDGSEISRTDYADLFACIGEKFGAGDGSTTFNVPDLRDKTIQGRNENQTIGESLEAGLPNITGVGWVDHSDFNRYSFSGAFSAYTNFNGQINGADSGSSTGWKFNARNGETDTDGNIKTSGQVFGNSNTVQPPALVVNFAIKI